MIYEGLICRGKRRKFIKKVNEMRLKMKKVGLWFYENDAGIVIKKQLVEKLQKKDMKYMLILICEIAI